jgi:hypothetical protein
MLAAQGIGGVPVSDQGASDMEPIIQSHYSHGIVLANGFCVLVPGGTLERRCFRSQVSVLNVAGGPGLEIQVKNLGIDLLRRIGFHRNGRTDRQTVVA